jgi:predicted permease
MIANLRIAVRGFLRTPGFTITALATLAICLGANLAIFAVMDSVLLRPLPFPAPHRLVTMYNTYPKAGVQRDGSSLTNYYERRGTIHAFSSLAAFHYGSAVVGETGVTERTSVIRVSPEFFATLGVGPVMGRGFTEEETSFQTSGVVVITDGYWRQQLNAASDVLARSIRVDGVQKRVVGVLPPGFRFLSSSASLYLPLASDPAQRGPGQRHSGNGTELIARLAPGASLANAQSELDGQNAVLERDDPQAKMITDAGFRSLVVPLHADHVASIRPILLLLQAGVLLLVGIGAVNLVNLLLIRASGRAREIAIRQALGASRADIVRHVATEIVVLCGVGGVMGLAVAAVGIRMLTALGVEQLPLGAHVAFDARSGLMAVAAAAVLGIAIAAPIVWFTLRAQLGSSLRSESRGGTAGRAAQRLRHGFIVAQVSLAFMLLAGSSLLGLSLQRAMAVSPGFRPDHVLTGQVSLTGPQYGSARALVAFTERVMEALGRQPGVTAVGAITNIPLSGRSNKSAITVKGQVVRPGESIQGHYSYGVTGEYFAALGIPLRAGRFIDAGDVQRGDRVAVVDDDFARRYWPQGSAIGQQIFHDGDNSDGSSAFTVVGVVGAVKQAAVTERDAQGAAYFPFVYNNDANIYVVARTRQQPEALSAIFGKLVRDIDPDLPVDGVRSMDVRVANSLIARRSPALLAAVFAIVALLLAAIGTYGVLSYAVAQRRREIGVRLALGAQPQQIGAHFLTLGLRLLAGGSVFGVLGAAATGRLMQSVLFDVPALHVATLAGTAAVLAAVSLVASVIPARRATRVDPAIALAAE